MKRASVGESSFLPSITRLGGIVVILVAAGVSGCVIPYSGPSDTAFSPDGTKVGFLWYDAIFLGIPIEDMGGSMPASGYGYWATAKTSAWLSGGVNIERRVVTPHGESLNTFTTMFSPDSKYVAFANPSRIVVADTSGPSNVVRIEMDSPKDRILNLAWLSDRELVYATSDPQGNLSFRMRNLTSADQPGRVICRVDALKELSADGEGNTAVHWSPSGRWALFNRQASPKPGSGATGANNGHAYLLDAKTGKAIELDPALPLSNAAWKPDSSQALCMLYENLPKENSGRFHVYLLDASTGRMNPLPHVPPEGADTNFGYGEIEWTADGRRLVLHDGRLICLEPWSVVDLKKLFKMSYYSRWHVMPGRPGWFVVCESEGNERLLGSGTESSQSGIYAVNPADMRRIKLAEAMSYAISPDGRQIAQVNAWKKLTVQNIVLQSEPATQPAKELTMDLGNKVTLKLVLIPAGKFMMGSPVSEEGRFDNEGPRHEETITKPFYMGIYTVTQEQYEQVMGKNPSNFKGAKNPVEQVSWDDAVEFCKKLSKKTGDKVRLPTEAEWEYACRAGSTSRFSYGDDANYARLGDYAWYHKNSDNKIHPVGQKKPNGWGLYDMHGNAWQWCSDWRSDSYENGNQTGPAGSMMGTLHVVRGGGWDNDPQYCRSAFRPCLGVDPGYRDYIIGFRVVVDLP